MPECTVLTKASRGTSARVYTEHSHLLQSLADYCPWTQALAGRVRKKTQQKYPGSENLRDNKNYPKHTQKKYIPHPPKKITRLNTVLVLWWHSPRTFPTAQWLERLRSIVWGRVQGQATWTRPELLNIQRSFLSGMYLHSSEQKIVSLACLQMSVWRQASKGLNV